jgi:hypothetical protein
MSISIFDPLSGESTGNAPGVRQLNKFAGPLRDCFCFLSAVVAHDCSERGLGPDATDEKHEV